MKSKNKEKTSIFERRPGDITFIEKMRDISKDPVAIKKREDGLELLKKAGLIPQDAK